ncbi:hypothetical protein HI914_07055 [Erysiphe necator]|nr:hypothetical protein HI914_07055 [Erysiphe necator]
MLNYDDKTLARICQPRVEVRSDAGIDRERGTSGLVLTGAGAGADADAGEGGFGFDIDIDRGRGIDGRVLKVSNVAVVEVDAEMFKLVVTVEC